jgi:hypothetical protein
MVEKLFFQIVAFNTPLTIDPWIMLKPRRGGRECSCILPVLLGKYFLISEKVDEFSLGKFKNM